MMAMMMMSDDGGPNRKLATQKLLPGLDHTGQPVLEPPGKYDWQRKK